MKKIILGAALLSCATLAHAERDYPHPEQFKEYNVKGTDIYILKDAVTGCEYMTRKSSDGYILREGSCNTPKTKG